MGAVAHIVILSVGSAITHGKLVWSVLGYNKVCPLREINAIIT